MFFKNARTYSIKSINRDALEQQLSRAKFEPCSAYEAMSRGWVSPRNDGNLVYAQGNNLLIKLRTEQRILPASVVNDEVRSRAEEMEAQQGYAVGRKQLRELKERVIGELIPPAFRKSIYTSAWIDLGNNLLVIDASTPSKAESLIEVLRVSLDDLQIGMINTEVSPTSAMADILASGEAPEAFTVDRDCELKSVSEERSAVRYVKHALDGEEIEQEIKSHLAEGKLPTKLAMTWDDRISFVLHEDGSLKRLTYLDLLKDEAQGDTEEEQFDADFALMTGELWRCLYQITNIVLGGTKKEEA